MRQMTLILLAIATTGSLSCESSTGEGGTGGNAAPLFNERNLEGWSYHLVEPDVKMEDVWSVRDGILVCKGEPLGYIHTEKNYTSFKLVLEWRWAPGTEPGNSGVLMRVNGEPRGVPRCLEAQLQSGNAGDLYGFHGMKINGDPARLTTKKNHEIVGDLVGVSKMEALEKPPGEWNVYEITADGPRVTASINGKKVNEAWDCDVVDGPIALQSEGGEIHFRRIALTPIE